MEPNKSNSEYLEPAFRRLRTEDRGQKETDELLHHGFGMQFTFRRQTTDELVFRRLRTEDRGQKETDELLHHGFGMQFVGTKKQTKQNALEKRNIIAFRNRFSFKTKIISFFTILSFNISFVIPLTVFSFLSSSPLDAQSVPTLGSTKQFANDELKPYVDAAKAGATDSG
ncbi:hypothetical protein LEP1GSC133_0082, partial [Leptospira borgpetersenii serovar Pomona str. 200901868]